MAEPPDNEPIDPDEGNRELAFLRPFSDAEARDLLQRYRSELRGKSGNLTPKEQAKLALLIEFCIEDD